MKVKQVTADRMRWDDPENWVCSVLLKQSVDPKRDFTLPLLLPIAFF